MNELINIIGGAVTSAGIYFLYMGYKERRDAKPPRVRHDLSASIATEDNYMPSKTFTVRYAMNGQYIEFRRFKYNPHGPNNVEQCVYIVKDNETLIDAISVVLVLMNKEE